MNLHHALGHAAQVERQVHHRLGVVGGELLVPRQGILPVGVQLPLVGLEMVGVHVGVHAGKEVRPLQLHAVHHRHNVFRRVVWHYDTLPA